MSLSVKYLDSSESEQVATVSGTNLQSFSNSASIGMGAPDTPWATLETGVWTLDGTRQILPDSPQGIGWWGLGASGYEVSGAVLGQAIIGQMVLGQTASTGTLAGTPTITIKFNELQNASTISIVFSPSTEQWCSEIRVKWYNGSAVISSIKAFPDSARWTSDNKVEDFNKVVVELVSTNNSGQLAKVQQIQIGGQTMTFEKDELVRVRLVNEVDPSFGNLTVDTMYVEVVDKKGRNLAPQQNQRMELYRDGTLIAAHFIESSSRETASFYTFSCQSAIGLLEDDFLGGMYDSVPVDTMLSDILNGHKYEIADAYKSATVTGYIPVCTRRQALQHVVLALGAMVTTQGGDAIRLIPLPTSAAHGFGKGTIFSGAKISTAPRIARCEVTAHGYTKSTTEETLLNEEPMSGTDVLITFDSPHYDYVITGGTITDSDANWIKVTAEGVVTVTAKSYTHIMTVHSRSNPAATHAERNNVIAITDATLVNSGNVKSVLNKLYMSGQRRQTLKQEVVVDGHRAGEMVSSPNPWGTETKGIITSMDSELTQNGHTAVVTILGAEAGSAESGGGGVYRFSGEIYSNEQEVLY